MAQNQPNIGDEVYDIGESGMPTIDRDLAIGTVGHVFGQGSEAGTWEVQIDGYSEDRTVVSMKPAGRDGATPVVALNHAEGNNADSPTKRREKELRGKVAPAIPVTRTATPPISKEDTQAFRDQQSKEENAKADTEKKAPEK